ncbi:hypothetical protein [Sphingomonas sp.]|uniref:hypothetical protein n=1 Tax=Sphingomonas sp. TaxID=28214 RepID=UPI001EC6913C|nr:hypothetical protein [Sphingomonas sp.]MBX3594635.1 hypothetical protein [Sphingomonas sp.]
MLEAADRPMDAFAELERGRSILTVRASDDNPYVIMFDAAMASALRQGGQARRGLPLVRAAFGATLRQLAAMKAFGARERERLLQFSDVFDTYVATAWDAARR